MHEATRIGEAFLSSASLPPGSQLVPEEVGRRIEAEHATARKRWNRVEIDVVAFARALGARCASRPSLLKGLCVLDHATDFYLAVACESGDGAALAAFDQAFLRDVGRYVASVRQGADFADEVAQVVRERLFVGGADGRPRIADYDGSGALASWVRVMSKRAALNQIRGAGERRAVDDASAALADLPASDNPELEYAKTRHARELRDALIEARRGLTEKQQLLLKYYYADKRSTVELGPIFRVNQSTVSRWLAETQGALARSAFNILKVRLRLDDKELASLARFVRSRIGDSFLVVP